MPLLSLLHLRSPQHPVLSRTKHRTHTQHCRVCVPCFVLHRAEGRLQIVTCLVDCVYLEDWGWTKSEDVGRGYGMGGTEGVLLRRLVCVWMYVPRYVHVCTYVYMYVFMNVLCTSAYICVCMYVYMQVCTYLCMYVYTHVCICSADVAQVALPAHKPHCPVPTNNISLASTTGFRWPYWIYSWGGS